MGPKSAGIPPGPAERSVGGATATEMICQSFATTGEARKENPI